MRHTSPQLPLVAPWIAHPHADELAALSALLDAQPVLRRLIQQDLDAGCAYHRHLRGAKRRACYRVLLALNRRYGKLRVGRSGSSRRSRRRRSVIACAASSRPFSPVWRR